MLTRGANTALTATTLEITVTGASQGAVDLLVFQLSEARKVRSDADFVFFNQPVSPEGAVRLTGPATVSADLTQLPADVTMLRVAVALDDSVPGDLRAVPGLGASVRGGGDTVVEAPADGLSTERAAVLIEIYRYADSWKVRNVSAGWAAGFAALVTDQGVDVESDSTPPPPSALAPPVAPPVAPAPPVTLPPPVPPAPPVTLDPPSPQPPMGPPVGAPPFAPPTGPAVSNLPPPPAPPTGPAVSNLPPPPAASAVPAPAGTIDLGKRTGTINLTKGQRVSIDGASLITASIFWPPATDYDVYALVLFADGHVETVSTFGTKVDPRFSLRTDDGSVAHGGDVGRTRGAGGGFFGRKATPAPQQLATERIEIRPHPGIRAVVPVAYSAQSNGTGSFRRYQVSMVIDNGQGTTVRVDAANADANDKIYTCVPGIVIVTPDGVTIDSLELYSAPGSEARPLLAPNAQVQMDAGPLNAYK